MPRFRDDTARIEQLLRKYDPLAVMGYFVMREGVADPDTYKEYEHRGAPMKIEHVALLYGKHPYLTDGSPLLDAGDTNAIADYLDRIPLLLPFI
jgi:hypothetical protein